MKSVEFINDIKIVNDSNWKAIKFGDSSSDSYKALVIMGSTNFPFNANFFPRKGLELQEE